MAAGDTEYLNLGPNEKIVLVSHHHWVNLVPFFASTITVILAGFAVIGYAARAQGSAGSLLPGLNVSIVTPIVALVDVFAILILFFAYMIDRQNKIILTNIHFIEITQSGLFNRTLSKLSLDELQDSQGSRKGVFGTILNYGEILIETAGAEENFYFRPAPDPLNIAEQINDCRESFEEEREEGREHELAQHVQQDFSQPAQVQPVAPPPPPQPQPTQPAPPASQFPESAFTAPRPPEENPPTQ